MKPPSCRAALKGRFIMPDSKCLECGELVSSHRLLCVRHWQAQPEQVRREVTWMLKVQHDWPGARNYLRSCIEAAKISKESEGRQ